MPRFQPLGEELLSAVARPRGSEAAGKLQADGVSQGCAQGARHCVGEAHSLHPELGFARAEGGEGTRKGWGLGERGWGGIREAQSGGGRTRVWLPPRGEWARLAPSSPVGRRTRRIRNREVEEEEKQEKTEEEAGRRAD